MIASHARQNKARSSTKKADGWRRSAPRAGRSTVERRPNRGKARDFFDSRALLRQFVARVRETDGYRAAAPW